MSTINPEFAPSHIHAHSSAYLTTKEAARFLNLSHRTLEDWRLRGGGPLFRKWPKGTVRYALADLIAFADGGVQRTTACKLAA